MRKYTCKEAFLKNTTGWKNALTKAKRSAMFDIQHQSNDECLREQRAFLKYVQELVEVESEIGAIQKQLEQSPSSISGVVGQAANMIFHGAMGESRQAEAVSGESFSSSSQLPDSAPMKKEQVQRLKKLQQKQRELEGKVRPVIAVEYEKIQKRFLRDVGDVPALSSEDAQKYNTANWKDAVKKAKEEQSGNKGFQQDLKALEETEKNIKRELTSLGNKHKNHHGRVFELVWGEGLDFVRYFLENFA